MHKNRATVPSHSRRECTQQPLRSPRTWVTRHTVLVLRFDNNNKKHGASKTKQKLYLSFPPPYAFIGSLQRSKMGERDLLSKKEDEIATPKKSQRKNSSSIEKQRTENPRCKTAFIFGNKLIKLLNVKQDPLLFMSWKFQLCNRCDRGVI